MDSSDNDTVDWGFILLYEVGSGALLLYNGIVGYWQSMNQGGEIAENIGAASASVLIALIVVGVSYLWKSARARRVSSKLVFFTALLFAVGSCNALLAAAQP